MPVYTFECQDCNVKFDRNLKMGDHESHPCPSCKEGAPRVIEGFSFAFAPGGSATANSGVHDHDYPTADKLIGRDADKKREFNEERDKIKQAAREAAGTHALMREDSSEATEYRPMGEAGRDARRRLAKQAIETLRSGKAPKGAVAK
jgi:putative FmdB family regulatory protein